MKKVFNILFVGIIGFILNSCDLPPSDYYNNNSPIPDSSELQYEIINKLFDVTENDEKTVYTFDTNVREFSLEKGTTFWNVIKKSQSFENFEVNVRKCSGKPYGGYGIVFNVDINTKSMFCILINTKQQVCFGKIRNGGFNFIENWSNENSYLYSGWNTDNKIYITKETSDYYVYINDLFYKKIAYDSEIAFEGNVGLCAVITSHENFPEEAVKIVWEY